jgi:simple sugar transport system ATP-binding protein
VSDPAATLELKGIAKRFGSVQALRGVDFVLREGTVHALLGENGAGKSTLMDIAYGMIVPDHGAIHVRGRAAAIRSPRDARHLGIGMVHQHFTSVGALTVRENVVLAGGRAEGQRTDDGAVLRHLWEGLDLDARVETLSVSLKQRLEILKALATGATTLLLDEPTGVLAPPEVDELLALARQFASAGGSVVLITHKLDEALAVADHVTVLRHGVVTLDSPMAGQGPDSLAAAMLGQARVERRRSKVESHRPQLERHGTTVVSLDQVTVRPLEDRGPGLRKVTLTIQAGELVGVAAVEGNGQRELMLGLAGLLPVVAGTRTVTDPVLLVPEDRTTEALIPEFTLAENIALGRGADAPWIRGVWLNWDTVRRRTAALLPAFDVRAPGPDTLAGQLSGGNQQKLVVARALDAEPVVLVVENPTRGLDIAATAAIHERLRQAAAAGVAVLVYSSDLDEVFHLGCDRLLVVVAGQVRELSPDTARDLVGRAMLDATA